MKKIGISLGLLITIVVIFMELTQPIIYEVTPDSDFIQGDPTSTKIRAFTVDKNEYPFASHWFERDGVAMHYIDEGEGIPIVLTHGNPDWSFLNRNIVKALSGEARMIAYDLPGFGFSDIPEGYGFTPQEHVEWISALIFEHLKLKKFILVVQDWGGPTGLSVATSNPASIYGIVISNTWAWDVDLIFRGLSYAFRTPIMERIVVNRNIFVENIMFSMLNEDTLNNKAITDAYIMPTATPDRRYGTAIFPAQATISGEWLDNIESKLGVLADKPVEFIFGTKDVALTSKASLERWYSHFPNAPVKILPNANHYTQEDSPESFVGSLRRILETVKAEEASKQ